MGLLLFLIWIVSEGVIIAQLGEAFGASRVLLYLVLAVVAGVIVIQRHGLRAIQQVRESMNRGELPAAAMINGLLGVVAGVLLILPGLLSDAVAVLLLVGTLRRWFVRSLDAQIAKARPDLRRPVVLEGEFRDTTRPQAALPPDQP